MNHDTDPKKTAHTGSPMSGERDAASSAASAAREAMHDTKAQLSAAFMRARETAAETSDTVGSAVLDLMDRRRSDFAGGFNEVAEALHRASREAGDQTVPSRFVSLTADTFGSFAQAIEERSSREIVRSLTDFGRTNPATFVVTTLLAGFAVGRLLTAEDPSRRDEDEHEDEMHAHGARASADLSNPAAHVPAPTAFGQTLED